MDVIAHLFSFISEDSVFLPGDAAFHQVRQETVQLGPGMVRPRYAAAPERRGLEAEIPPVFLDEQVCGGF